MKSSDQDIENLSDKKQTLKAITNSRIYALGSISIAKTVAKEFFIDVEERGKVSAPDSKTNQNKPNSEPDITTETDELTPEPVYRFMHFAQEFRAKLSEDTKTLLDSISQRIESMKEEDLKGDLDQGNQIEPASKKSSSRLTIYGKGIRNELICRAERFKENALNLGYKQDYEFRKRRQQREETIKSLTQRATSWAGIATKQDIMEINRMVYQLAQVSNSKVSDGSEVYVLERRKNFRRTLDVPVLYDQRINTRRQQLQS